MFREDLGSTIVRFSSKSLIPTITYNNLLLWLDRSISKKVIAMFPNLLPPYELLITIPESVDGLVSSMMVLVMANATQD